MKCKTPYWSGLLLAAMGAVIFQSAARAEQAAIERFDSNAPLAQWVLTGEASLVASGGRADGALRVGSGGKAVLKLRDADGSGRVEMWVKDDLSRPADPKARRAGPRWGLSQADGQVVVAGVIYAPYLAGETTYAASAGDPKTPLAGVQYTGSKRSGDRQKWTFDFSPDKGLDILVNDRKVRFDWNKTNITGFNGVVIMGDEAKEGAHTLLVDDISVTLGGPMNAKPVPPPPPPPVVPERDPAIEKPRSLVPAVNGKHPRLLFSAADIPALRQKAAGAGRPFMQQIEQYLAACTPPVDDKFITDATDAQRQGFWRLPTVALHYVLTQNPESLQTSVGFLKVFVAQEHWETGAERDAGMSAANNMVGAALAYDWLYSDLEPEFREQVRTKLLTHARRMYYGGHLMKVGKTHYWQQDPHNNHRWHRNAGLALCALAVADDARNDDDWILEKTIEELQFIHKWLPDDGSSHESPSYLVFGGPYLVLAFQAVDRCVGTDLMGHVFFKTTPGFRIATIAPGFSEAFGFGDSGGFGFYNNYNLAATARHRLADEQAALLKLFQAQPRAYEYGWMSLIWFDPTVGGGDASKVSKRVLFDDVGVAVLRDGWDASNVAMMLKAGPYGGKILNKYRNELDGKYINVAHDDPDANMFVLWGQGGWLAANDGYAKKKLTSSHNTLLVDGKGQLGEGSGWTQPFRAGGDMSKMACHTAWHDGGDTGVSVTEGESAGAYTGLDAYRRTVVWVPGRYILLLDNVVASSSKPREFTWNMQATAADIRDPSGRFTLSNGRAECALHVASPDPFEATIVDSTAENRGQSLGLRQLRLTRRATHWHLASAFDPWKVGDLKVALQEGGGTYEVRVTAGGKTDTWAWRPVRTQTEATGLVGRLADGTGFELKQPKDKD